MAVCVVLIATILAGLARRGRLRSCVSFDLYLVAVAVPDALVALWPSRFFRRDFWILKDSLHNLLKLAIALELAVRIFRHFPSAYRTVRRGVMVVVASLAVLIGYALSSGTDYIAVVGRLHPVVYDGTVWLLVCIGVFCLWYHLPLDALHKAILIGLVPYLLVYSVLLRALVALGWERGNFFNLTAPHAYICVLVYWAVVAWGTGPGTDSGSRVAEMIAERK
jgi:hypothetical protein